MARLFEKEWTRPELMKHIGDISQIAGAKQYELTDGKGKGVACIDVRTGSGLIFTILPDRGMDISHAEYKGIPLSFISKTGIVSPAYYEEDKDGFLRSFYGGLLTTCGLTYMGASCRDGEDSLGLHGRISNTPAEDVSVIQEWDGDEYIIKARGKIRESKVFGEHLVLTREISTTLGSNNIRIRDRIENLGFNKQPLMLLYHCNFGYPIISEKTELVLTSNSTKARDSEAEKGIAECNVFNYPTHDYKEQVFYHKMEGDEKGWVSAYLHRNDLGASGLVAYLRYNANELPYFIEWKQMGEGDYALGLEPATWLPEGRAEARKRGELYYLMPGEEKTVHLEFGIVEG